MAVFVEEGKYLSAFSWFTIIDTNCGKIIVKNRKPAKFLVGKRHHVCKNAAIFDVFTPLASGACQSIPSALLHNTNVESLALMGGNFSRIVGEFGGSDLQAWNYAANVARNIVKRFQCLVDLLDRNQSL